MNNQKINDISSEEIVKKVLLLLLCLVIALFSIFVVAKKATDPLSYKNTIESLDEKKATVMGVTATAAAVSTGLAAIPGDATTPIANQIMELSSYLLIVVCALVLEKSLLTVFGYLTFQILIPLACVFFAVSIFLKRPILKILGMKIAVFGLVIAVVIPFSMKISDMIYVINESAVDELVTEAEGIEPEEEQEKNWWEKIVDKIEAGASNASEKAKQILNKFIDTVALFIIAYCAIPIVIFMIVIWFVKFLFNITIPVPSKKSIKSIDYYREEE